MTNLTSLLAAAAKGDVQAARDIYPLVYDELRGLAAAKMAHELPGQTLDATALVHEAYIRLVAGVDGIPKENQQLWQNRGHFMAAAAEAMRRILIDNARRKSRERHGGKRQRVDLPDVPATAHAPDELLAVDEALTSLAAEDANAAALVKLRFYAGLSVEEAGESLGISRAEAYRQWDYARAWLRCALANDESSS